MGNDPVDKNIGLVKDYFKWRIEEHGSDLRALDWHSVESQRARFKVLTEIGDLKGHSILDVGCGFGDFYGFLNESDIEFSTYLGLDLVEEMIERARRKYPDAAFVAKNILQNIVEPFDYVLASGLFYLKLESWFSYTRSMLEEMFSICRLGVGVNFLNFYSEKHSPGSYYAFPATMLEVALELSQKVVLRCDYKPNDFTIYIYK